jgi:hypothetical protein
VYLLVSLLWLCSFVRGSLLDGCLAAPPHMAHAPTRTAHFMCCRWLGDVVGWPSRNLYTYTHTVNDLRGVQQLPA